MTTDKDNNKESRENQDLRSIMSLLELTAKNQALAEQYLDLSKPENTDLLKEAEYQSFQSLSYNTKAKLHNFLEEYKERNAELASRYVRLVAAMGRETAERVLARWGLFREIDYLQQFLSPVQITAMRADEMAWDFNCLKESYITPCIELGLQDPEIFWQARELCGNKKACNTQMLLAALYLRCTKPLSESKSRLGTISKEDKRAAENPAHIKEMTEYLENRLIGNIDGLFEQSYEPAGKDMEILQDFVRSASLDAPIPQEVWAVLSNRRQSKYLMAFLPFLSFLAIEHSDKFISMLRLATAFDRMSVRNLPLTQCLAAGEIWFCRHIAALESYLEVPDDIYIRWALQNKQARVLERMASKAPETVCEVLKDIPAQQAAYLTTCVEAGNPKLYRKMKESFADSYRRAAAQQLVQDYDTAQDEARRYLLGELEISDILPYVEAWHSMHIIGYCTRCENIRRCGIRGAMQVYRRALVLECLLLERYYFCNFWIDLKLEQTEGRQRFKYQDVRQVKDLLKLMEEENIPPQRQIEFLGTQYDSYYIPGQTDNISEEYLMVIAACHKDWHQEWKAASTSRLLPARVMAIRVMGIQWQEYKDELLSCASESSKQARDFVRAILTGRPEWEEDILAKLKSPRGAEREMAIEVLQNWETEKYRSQLTIALQTEKTKKIRTMLQNILGTGSQNEDEPIAEEWTLEKLVQETLAGGWKRKLSWLPLDTFPKVRQKDKKEAFEKEVFEKEASKEYLAAILISYADMKELGINKDARRLAAELHTAELAAYIKEVYRCWLDDGAQAKRKWVLYAASIHGGDAMITELYTRIQDWAKNSRGAIAAEAVKAMALNPSPTALVQVDQISRKFKYYQVKKAATEALDYAAEQLGITRDEMEDRIVPSLGFDAHMERIFDYGKRQFKAVLTPVLSIEVYDEKGKQLKNMPAPGKTDDPELSKAANDAWKLLKKQLKTVVANQKLRLEQALSTQRYWQTASWKELFVKNPVMRQFAIGLIWGIYEGGRLTKTFRYMEDGTFNTADEEEYILPEDRTIGLVHPIELPEEVLSAWKAQIADYEIIQPIEQLERPIFRVTEEEKEEMDLTRFGGVVVNSLSLSGKLQSMGWYKGDVGDGGGFDTYYRYDYDKNAELVFSGDYIGCSDTDVDIYEVHFGQAIASAVTIEGTVTGEALRIAPCKLGEVDPRYFSETILQITRATASSKEKRPYPQCKRW